MPWKKHFSSHRIVASCLLLLSMGTFAQGEERVSSDRRLPKETFAYVSISNAPEFGRQWGKTSLGQLFRDKALLDFWKDAQEKLAEKQKDLEQVLGAQLTDLPQIAQGEVSLALCKSDSNGLSLVAFLHHGDKPELLDKLLEKAEKALSEKGIKRSEQEISETKVITFKKAAGDEGDKGKDEEDDAPAKKKTPPEISYFQKEGTMVFGTDLEILKLILGRWDGQHEQSLAKQEIYRYIVDHCRDEQQTEPAPFVWYVDPVGGFISLATSKQGDGQMKKAVDFIPVVGLDKLRGWGGVVEFPGSEFDLVSRSILYLDKPPTGLANLMQFQPDAQAPPKWVRSDVAGYVAINWDFKQALAGIESLFDSFQGPNSVANMFDKIAEAPNGPNVHPKKDLLDHISGHMHIITYPPQGEGTKALESRAVMALELKDAAAVKATIAKLVPLLGPKFKSREFQGESLLEIPRPGGPKGAEGPAYGMLIAEGHLMFSTDITLLEQILRTASDQEPLADSAAYKRIARKFPEKTSSINFSRQDVQIRAIYDMIRSGVLNAEAEKKTGIDFSKLPEFATLQKYFTLSASYSVIDEHGLKTVSFSLPASTEDK